LAKRKAASVPIGTATLTLCLNPSLHDGLKRLASRRKDAKRDRSKPVFITGMVDDAIIQLSAQLKKSAPIAFIPTPRSHEGRTALRVGAKAHEIASQASEAADVKLADFVRTALTQYLRNHTDEIDQKAQTSTNRGRKQARRKV
jgi:hypothetical protein